MTNDRSDTPEEAAILAELAVTLAIFVARPLDPDLVVTVASTPYLDRLQFLSSSTLSRRDLLAILSPLLELGTWLPEAIHWIPSDDGTPLRVQSVFLVRARRT